MPATSRSGTRPGSAARSTDPLGLRRVERLHRLSWQKGLRGPPAAVVRVGRRKAHPQLEAGGAEDARKGLDRGGPASGLVRGDGGLAGGSALRQFGLAEARLPPCDADQVPRERLVRHLVSIPVPVWSTADVERGRPLVLTDPCRIHRVRRVKTIRGRSTSTGVFG